MLGDLNSGLSGSNGRRLLFILYTAVSRTIKTHPCILQSCRACSRRREDRSDVFRTTGAEQHSRSDYDQHGGPSLTRLSRERNTQHAIGQRPHLARTARQGSRTEARSARCPVGSILSRSGPNGADSKIPSGRGAGKDGFPGSKGHEAFRIERDEAVESLASPTLRDIEERSATLTEQR